MDNCPNCGASYALVGRVHNCRPPIVKFMHAVADMADAAIDDAVVSATYKYRDKEKRRAQVAANMRAYRARKRANGKVILSEGGAGR